MAVVLVFFSSFAQDEILRLTVTGSAEGRTRETLDRAIVDAKENAIAEYARSLGAPAEPAFLEPLLRHVDDYVQSFTALRKERGATGATVEIEAHLYHRLLRGDIAKLLAPGVAPHFRLVFLISARQKGAAEGLLDSAEAEKALAELFRGYSFELADSAAIRAQFTPEELQEKLATEEGRIRVARATLAGVAVLGEGVVTVEAPPPGSNAYIYRAEVELQVIGAEERAMEETLSAKATVYGRLTDSGAQRAFLDACERLHGDVFVETVLACVQAPDRSAAVITVTGLADVGRYEQILGMLRGLPGAGEVEAAHFSPAASRIRLQFRGGMGALTRSLQVYPFAGFRLKPRMVVGAELTFEAVPAG